MAFHRSSQDTGGRSQRSRSFWHVGDYYCKSANCQGWHGVCCASQDPASSLQDDTCSGQVHTWQARNEQQALDHRYMSQNTMASTDCERFALPVPVLQSTLAGSVLFWAGLKVCVNKYGQYAFKWCLWCAGAWGLIADHRSGHAHHSCTHMSHNKSYIFRQVTMLTFQCTT